MGIGALPFLLPLLLQAGFGLSAFQLRPAHLRRGLGALTMKFAAKPILRRFGFRRVLIANAAAQRGSRSARSRCSAPTRRTC